MKRKLVQFIAFFASQFSLITHIGTYVTLCSAMSHGPASGVILGHQGESRATDTVLCVSPPQYGSL
jgi:hypothetical protein